MKKIIGDYYIIPFALLYVIVFALFVWNKVDCKQPQSQQPQQPQEQEQEQPVYNKKTFVVYYPNENDTITFFENNEDEKIIVSVRKGSSCIIRQEDAWVGMNEYILFETTAPIKKL